MADQPTSEATTEEHDADAILQWIRSLEIDPSKVIKVLVLGNSGAGKSFLCNSLLGADVFHHKTQAKSCTSANSFSGVLIEEGTPNQTAYVVCNIPGLIEADVLNVPRNEQAIQDAFKLLPHSPTLLMFVLRNTKGRLLDEDFQAVKCVMDYVKFDTASLCCVVNSVKWDELDQRADEYRADVTKLIRAITQRRNVEVDFVAELSKEIREDYDCPDMELLNGQLVVLLKKLKPTIVSPAPDAKIVLEKSKLEAAMRELKGEMAAQRRANEDYVRNEKKKWDKEVADMQASHERDMAEAKKTIEALRRQPPKVAQRIVPQATVRKTNNSSGCHKRKSRCTVM